MRAPHPLAAIASDDVDNVDNVVSIDRTPRESRHYQRDIDGLAMALLDLESGYEQALRTVLSVHRMCERVRHATDASPDAGLLIGEMSRQMTVLGDGAGTLRDRLNAASRRVATLQRDGE